MTVSIRAMVRAGGMAECREMAPLCDQKASRIHLTGLLHRGAISLNPSHFNESRDTAASCNRLSLYQFFSKNSKSSRLHPAAYVLLGGSVRTQSIEAL